MIITIDGPAGSGKTTVARALAKKLQIPLLESGAFYRFITWALLENNRDLGSFKEETELESFIDCLFSSLEVILEPEGTKLYFHGRELRTELRSREVEAKVSEVSAHPLVRGKVGSLLRKLSSNRSLITEGRDMGTVVFPQAGLKIYLTADLEVRAKRRFKDVQDRDFEEVVHNLRQRDTLDSEREVAPLKKPVGAIEIDTTNLTVDEVVSKIESLIGERECSTKRCF
uniref:Cytidylate kinase n=1 Tax=Caldimicrobium thiodismutans TaxID=1653476 RepID=A0A832LVX3_9BACT